MTIATRGAQERDAAAIVDRIEATTMSANEASRALFAASGFDELRLRVVATLSSP